MITEFSIRIDSILGGSACLADTTIDLGVRDSNRPDSEHQVHQEQ